MYRLGLIQHQRGREVDAIATLERCRDLALVEHDERALVFERVVRAWALGALGRYGEALSALDDVSTIGRGEESVVRGRVPNTRASLLFDLGLIEMALDADEESLEITQARTEPAPPSRRSRRCSTWPPITSGWVTPTEPLRTSDRSTPSLSMPSPRDFDT